MVAGRGRTKWEAPLSFCGDATAPEGDEVRNHETEDVHAHLFHDSDAFLTLMGRLNMPDRCSACIASIAYACNESSPDHLCHVVACSLKDDTRAHDHSKHKHRPSTSQFLADEQCEDLHYGQSWLS